ncbi:MAG: N-acetylmuramate alpha-1-phosphate uridylyltransferase MurU [Gammaproteobacteria bacterium]
MILAAGRGERMLPLTRFLPKPLLQVNGETLLERHVARLRRAGFTELVINVSYLGERIEQHLGAGEAFGVHIQYSREPDGPMETAGGIARALGLLGEGPFVVVNADVWTAFNFSRLRSRIDQAHIVLVPNPAHNVGGDFALQAGRLRLEGSESFTYAGIGVFRSEFFDAVGTSRIGLGHLLRDAAAVGMASGEIFYGTWFDVGTPERLAEARGHRSIQAK